MLLNLEHDSAWNCAFLSKVVITLAESYFPHIAGVISCEFPGASDQEGRLRDAEQIEELAL